VIDTRSMITTVSAIEVVAPGLLTTVQDLGRRGYAHLGVPRSGALDTPALVLANRLVGNPDGAAGLETTMNGVAVRTTAATLVATTGARAAVTVDGTAISQDTPWLVPAGSVVKVWPAISGVRCYVAFAGGVDVAPVLGSRCTDTLSGLGPPPLRAGQIIPLGPPSPSRTSCTASTASTASEPRTPQVRIRVRLGPRHDWFTPRAVQALLTQVYTVTVKSNRVGVRLSGPVLDRAVRGELPSEGIVLGAVQVPGDGQPLVFLADHPPTGGYPVVAVVDQADLPLVAQARPGTPIEFARAAPTEEVIDRWT
jgi:biotin-dependent carboxylase-like uncharacterized protein